MQCFQSGRLAIGSRCVAFPSACRFSASAVCRHQPVVSRMFHQGCSTSRTLTPVVAGLKKEKKKLEKMLKSHRRRLERMLVSVGPGADSGAMLEVVNELQATTAVLEQIAAYKKARLEEKLALMTRDMCSSSDEESDVTGRSGSSVTSVLEHPAPSTSSNSQSNKIVVSSLNRTLEVEVPSLPDEPGFTSCVPYLAQGQVQVCHGGKCRANGASEVLDAIVQETRGSSGVVVTSCKCMGQCRKAVAVKVSQPEQPTQVFTQVQPDAVRGILQESFSHTSVAVMV